MAEAPALASMSERQQQRLDHANDLIPPLFDLFAGIALPITVADALAGWSKADQQSLLAAVGAERISGLKVADIQQAKREATPSHTESEIEAILNRVRQLQEQKDALERQVASQSAPSADLQARLDQAEAERAALEQELDHLRQAPPTVVEKLVEKVIEVEKPVPDPAQAAVIATLESELAGAQDRIENMLAAGHKRAELANLDAAKKALEKRLEELRHAMAQTADLDTKADHTRLYRATIAKFVEDIHKKLKPLLGDWQRITLSSPRSRLSSTLASCSGLSPKLTEIG